MDSLTPSFRRLFASGELAARAAALEDLLESCTVCPRACRVDRRKDLGRCATPANPVTASWGPHHGEEPPVSGSHGSGTIFLANCNLRCVFCQNNDISQRPRDFMGRATSAERLAAIMLELQSQGCHNINWVSPTHQVPQLVAALLLAAEGGLSVPVVYNTNAFDSLEVLRLLDGIVDIYLPDLKYASDEVAAEMSRVPGYAGVARRAVAEMFRQVGAGWVTDRRGVLQRGLLVRLLLLPHDLAGAGETLRWIGQALSPEVAVSLMSQYRPAHLAARPGRFPALARSPTPSEYSAALASLARWNSSQHTLVQPYFRRS